MVEISDASDAIMTGRATRQLDEKVEHLFKAVGACLDLDLWEPTLILLYSGIDAMAWLDRGEDHANVTGLDFQDWTGRYVVPLLGTEISAADIWGARCGLLHSHTAESSLNRGGVVRKIFYRLRPSDPRTIIPFGLNEAQHPAILVIESLAGAVRAGFDNYRRDLLADTSRWNRARARINASYFNEVRVMSPPNKGFPFDWRFTDEMGNE